MTDANLVLGILDPARFLGGGMTLDPDKARAAIDTAVAQPLGISIEDAALAIRRNVEDAMGRAVGAVAERLGRPDGLPVIAYGGAGAIHAADIAANAGIGRVVITPFSAVSSAFGSSLMDVGHIYYRRADILVESAGDLLSAAPLVADMATEAARDMRGEGFDPADAEARLQLFWTGAGGEPEILVAAETAAVSDADAASAALIAAREALGTAGPLRLASIAYNASARVPHFEWRQGQTAAADLAAARLADRQVWFGGPERVATPVYDRARMGPGHTLSGPVIVESSQTTILVPEGWRLAIDAYDNALLERE
ncbi:hydantoinase/oxoprolinase family protein [Sphingosinicella microcystinivorans]|uniref:hydantoinase/oxoprolinase family protein n=1 Tax=Sphingosinicella microcystinivorans TaxID=335406 RepID=UPI0022F3CE83|nr:hydantoinase/oxoprolinase family protein [Sphingosinicella microcystinivorans]WBX85350.1 hydantoinase/oxoprolinase family protein [Sphingosinicella microcystinivorans]